MKKIILIMLILLLTGCGNSCEHDFENELTKNYSKDAKKCDVVKYKNEDKKIEFITTPSKDKKSFTTVINYFGYEIDYSYMDVKYTNALLKQYNGINFLELYDNAKINNTYLILFDDAGNIRYETASTSKPVIDGEKFTVKEYYTFVDGDYVCSDYEDKNVTAYTETTYNMIDMSVLNSKKYLIKDLCK